MSRVLILEPLRSDTDVKTLKQFGDVQMIFPLDTPSVFDVDDFKSELRQWLDKNGYVPNDDAFVLTGRNTKIALALGVICMYYSSDMVRVLMYDGGAHKYVERFI